MTYESRWKIIEKVGSGGQGEVYRIFDTQKFGTDEEFRKWFVYSLGRLSKYGTDSGTFNDDFKMFQESILKLVSLQDQSQYCALKILHKFEDARDFEKAGERIKKEIAAMSKVSHPNLLRIIDYDSESKWFVSPFFSQGTLSKQSHSFVGDFPKCLKAIRPLIAGVAELHKKGIVHRDIKPQNVFIGYNGELVLGDFGLVFFTDERHSRISETYENVGSRDWMPPWAMGMRIEDIKSNFDIYSLGKLLWSMVSGSPILRLWYFQKDEFNIEKLFPNSSFIQFANPLFAKSIVENEEDCLKDATELLFEIDKVLSVISLNADRVDPKVQRRCRVCGIGTYVEVIDRNITDLQNFGLNPAGSRSFKVFICNHCGNVQLFTFGDRKDPPAWT